MLLFVVLGFWELCNLPQESTFFPFSQRRLVCTSLPALTNPLLCRGLPKMWFSKGDFGKAWDTLFSVRRQQEWDRTRIWGSGFPKMLRKENSGNNTHERSPGLNFSSFGKNTWLKSCRDGEAQRWAGAMGNCSFHCDRHLMFSHFVAGSLGNRHAIHATMDEVGAHFQSFWKSYSQGLGQLKGLV